MKNMEVVFMPHPPMALPQLQRGQGYKIADTLKGYEAMAQRIGALKPDTIVYITPHGNSFSNGVCLLDEEEIKGDLAAFGYPEIEMSKKVNRGLNTRIYDGLDEYDLLSVLMFHTTAKQYGVEIQIDHGALVPMYFVDQVYSDYDVIHLTPSGQGLLTHYKLGVALREVLQGYDKNVVVVCSGDLSHALKSDGPYEFNPFGPVFDEMVVKAIEKRDPTDLIELDSKEEHAAAQCGLRSFLIGFGLMDGSGYDSQVVSYEGPFGVGYLTGYLSSDLKTERPSLLEKLEAGAKEAYEIRLAEEDPYVKLARQSVEHYVRTRTKLQIEDKPEYMDEETYGELISERAGAFVSIHKDGMLRGCIGTTEPTTASLLEEIIYCGISACSSDPRFNPIDTTELKSLEIKVDRLYAPERIYDLDELDVIRYGVIVEQGRKRGLLLPNLDGVDSIDHQVSIAKQKADIHSDDNLVYYRFEVERHE